MNHVLPHASSASDSPSKIAVITGGSRGIGAATAKLAAAQGYAVCISYRRHDAAAEQVCQTIRAAGGVCLAVRADVSSEADVIDLFDRCTEAFGTPTALVNNAGILETQMPLAQMSVERLQRILAVNVIGAFLCAREAVRRMPLSVGGKGGAIVNVSSRASCLGSPGEYVDYAASKGAIDTLTIGLSREVAADGVRVNAVRPGVIHTDIHAAGGEPDRVERVKTGIPMQRGGAAEEVAQAILWLLSDAASYTTGSFIDVAGGR
ncbi:SDR family oxidoreductase [Acidihalobacter ferrooxydans]|uniref:NAD(P)-dependent oxidoreductase n=1 Tax=Acidihalobacter ferrooxydans TaxID=1765967 RepID=A0A1P8UHJ3_9GAMM|nr:NAD(P)-dependent oxidoreductase [Acidihalobacter ferrooxydans]